MLKKLMSLPNVIVTPHQAFATQEALSEVADTTFYNPDCRAQFKVTENEVTGRGISDGYVPTPHGRMKVNKITHKVST